METIPLTSKNSSQNPGSAMGTSEGARRATGEVPMAGGRQSFSSLPDPEVPETIPRRRFTAAYKLRVLKQADQCTEPGQIGDLLRKQGLYSSHLTLWRRQRDQGILNGLTPAKRGRKAKTQNPLAKRVAELERETQRLQNKLKQARIIIEAQKKISEILGIEQDQEELESSK